jgi:ABC-type lipoprotein export system ATPase subunit
MSNKNFPKCGTECWASLSSIIIYFRINSPEKYKNASLRPGKLSGGHNHSAAVARELSLSFAIMFGDESRDNLDTKTDDPIYELLKLLNK